MKRPLFKLKSPFKPKFFVFKPKLLTLLISSILSSSAFAGQVYSGVDYQYFRDFAENKGKFTPGAQNIAVVNKKGESIGTMMQNAPMMDFSVVSRNGVAALVGDQYIVSVAHNVGYRNVDFGMEGSNPDQHRFGYNIVKRNNYKNDRTHPYMTDYHNPRLAKFVTEAAPIEMVSNMQGSTYGDLEKYPMRVRIGSGWQFLRDDNDNGNHIAMAYNYLTAGNTFMQGWANNGEVSLSGDVRHPNQYGPLPISGSSGDSGSPMFIYDKTAGKWLINGVLRSGHPYQGKENTYQIARKNYLDEIIAGDLLTVFDFTAASYDWTADDNGSGKLTKGGRVVTNTPLANYSLPSSGRDEFFGYGGPNPYMPALHHGKNIYFGNMENGTVTLKNNIDQGAGGLTFEGDFVVQPTTDETWKGAGVSVSEGSTVTWKVKNPAGDRLSKIGQGTLLVNGKGENLGDISVGDGVVVLNQQADEQGKKQAFNQLGIVSGRPTVKLESADQVDPNNIYFGFRGGRLDLNGHSLTFNRIQNTDEGAQIVNHNKDTAATITIRGNAQINNEKNINQSKATAFNGWFGETNATLHNGRLNIDYQPTHTDSVFLLSGGTNLNGNVTQTNGTLVFSGRPTPHAYNHQNRPALIGRPQGEVVIDDDWLSRTFKAEKYIINGGSAVVSRNVSAINGDWQLSNSANATLGVTDKQANFICARSDWTGLTKCASQTLSDKVFASIERSKINGNFTLNDNAKLSVLGLADVTGNVALQGQSQYRLAHNATQTGTLALKNQTVATVENATLAGDATLSDQAKLNFVNARFDHQIQGSKDTLVSLSDNANWTLPSSTTIGNLSLNNSQITLNPDFATQTNNQTFNQLTVLGDLSGNGTFNYRTYLQENKGDHVAVHGLATGNFVLNVRNTGAEPQTLQQLSLLTLKNTAQIDNVNVALANGTVDVGTYRYELKNDNHDYRLYNPRKEQELADQARLAEEKRKAEEAARLAKEKRKAEELARLAEEKRKADEAARLAEEARIAEAKAKAEELRLAEEQQKEELRLAEEKRKAEEEARLAEEARIAEAQAQEAARLAKEKRKADEAARLAEEAQIAEAKAKAEELRLAEEQQKEELRLAKEKRKAEEEARLAEEARIAEAQAQEAARLAEEKRKADEAARLAEEAQIAEAKAKAEELRLAEEQQKEELRLAKEKRKAEEEARLAEEARIAEAQAQEAARLAEEKRKADEAARLAEEAQIAEAKAKAEELRLAKEKRKAEEEARLAEEARIAEAQAQEAARLAEEKRKADEAARLAEEAQIAEAKAKAEELRLAEEQQKEELRLAKEKRKAEEEARLAEEARIAEAQAQEAARLAEEKRKADEAARLAEEKRKAEEAARLAEEARIAEAKAKAEELRLAKEKRKAEEEARLAEEARIAEAQAQEAARLAEEKRKADEAARLAEEAQIAEAKAKAEELRLAEEQQKEELRLAKEKRKAEEEARLAEEARIAEAQAQEAARLAEEKRKADEAARLAEEKRKAEEAARLAEEARIAEAKAKAEELRLAKEKCKAEEEARLAEEARIAEAQAQEAARLAEEKRKADEAARLAEEARIAKAKAQEETARLEEEKRKADEAQIAEAKAKAEELRLAEEQQKEELRLAKEKRKAEEEARLAEEARIAEAQAQEAARLAEEKRKADEAARLAEEARIAKAKAQEETARLEEEKRKADEAQIAEAKAKAEELRLAEEQQKEELRLAKEKRKAEEEARLAEEARIAEAQAQEAARLAEEKRKADEAARLAEEAQIAEAKAKAEELRLAEEQQKEELRLAEEKRKADEAVRLAEEARIAEAQAQEAARLAEEKRKAEEAQIAEAKAKAEELRLAEEQQKEELRLAEEKRKTEELARLAEEKRKADETAARLIKEQALLTTQHQSLQPKQKDLISRYANSALSELSSSLNGSLLIQNELNKHMFEQNSSYIWYNTAEFSGRYHSDDFRDYQQKTHLNQLGLQHTQDNYRAGLLLSYARTNNEFDDDIHGKSRLNMVSAFTQSRFENGINMTLDASRGIHFSKIFGKTQDADIRRHITSLGVGFDYQFDLNKLSIQPNFSTHHYQFLGASYVYDQVQVHTPKNQFNVYQAGATLKYTFTPRDNLTITPQVSIHYLDVSNAKFTTQVNQAMLNQSLDSRWQKEIGLQASFGGWSFSAYAAQTQGKQQEKQHQAGLKVGVYW